MVYFFRTEPVLRRGRGLTGSVGPQRLWVTAALGSEDEEIEKKREEKRTTETVSVFWPAKTECSMF